MVRRVEGASSLKACPAQQLPSTATCVFLCSRRTGIPQDEAQSLSKEKNALTRTAALCWHVPLDRWASAWPTARRAARCGSSGHTPRLGRFCGDARPRRRRRRDQDNDEAGAPYFRGFDPGYCRGPFFICGNRDICWTCCCLDSRPAFPAPLCLYL